MDPDLMDLYGGDYDSPIAEGADLCAFCEDPDNLVTERLHGAPVCDACFEWHARRAA